MTELHSPRVLELLTERRIASLATLDPDGSIQLTAVWYMYRQGKLFVPTVSSYRKVRNVRTTPKASLMIDSRSVTSMRGVCIQGRVEVIGAPQSFEINRLIHERYLTSKGASHPEVGPLFEEGDDTTIAIDCDAVSFWDMGEGNLSVLLGESGLLHHLDP